MADDDHAEDRPAADAREGGDERSRFDRFVEAAYLRVSQRAVLRPLHRLIVASGS